MVDLDVAAVGARAAHRLGALEVPDAGAKAKITIGQRADRADVDHVARVRVVEGPPRGEVQVDVVAALVEGELARVRHLVQEADAARAQHAALLVEDDERADRLRLLLAHLGRQGHAAPLPVVVHVVLLQLALARLVAHRAVDRVVDQEELEDRALRRPGLLARGVHHHAVRHARVTRDLELRHLLDLDQAHAAVAGDGETRVPAVVRDLDAEALGGANDGGAVLDRDPAAVDLNRGHGRERRILMVRAPRSAAGSGRGRRAARTRRGTW